jgi:hypothetical protein
VQLQRLHREPEQLCVRRQQPTHSSACVAPLTQQGKIKSLESIYLFSMPVKEYQVRVLGPGAATHLPRNSVVVGRT